MAAGGPAQHTYVGAPTGPPANYQQQQPDPTGQIAPAGMKPRVTATLWEDEGCMCFQVETKGVCVARRDGKLQGRFLHREHHQVSSSPLTFSR